jgi:uridine kinase
MLQGILWLFDDPISDLLLAGIFVLAALHHRQMRLLQRRTDELAYQVSELKMLIKTL